MWRLELGGTTNEGIVHISIGCRENVGGLCSCNAYDIPQNAIGGILGDLGNVDWFDGPMSFLSWLEY